MVLKEPLFNPVQDDCDSVLMFRDFHAGSLRALLYRHSIVDTGYRNALVLENGTMLYFDNKLTRSSPSEACGKSSKATRSSAKFTVCPCWITSKRKKTHGSAACAPFVSR